MGKSIIILSITVLFICGIHTSEDEKLGARNKRFGLDIGKPVEFLNSAKNILREVYDVWHVMLRQPNLKVTDAVFRSKEHEILGRLMTVSQQVAKLDEKLDSTSSTTINTLLLTFPNVVRLELRLHELGKMIAQINLADEQLRRYLIHGYQNETVEEVEIQPLQAEMFNLTEAIDNEVFDPKVNYRIARGTDRDPDRKWLIEEHTLQNFAQWATGHNSDSIPSLLGRIHMMISPDDKNFLSLGIFNLIKENANEVRASTCNLQQSPHQMLYNLYTTVALADLKGFAMIQFSYMLLKLYNKGNFTVESELAKNKYMERTMEKINSVRAAMAEADRTFFNCDPKQFVEGVNYVKLTKLLQGYVENEVNFNRESTCRENCAYYYYTEVHDCFKSDGKFCGRQNKCKGKVVECRYIDSDMEICKSSNPERRYDWIEYENGRVLGNKGTCQSRDLFKVDSWWRYLFWHCSYCFCLCDDNDRTSDRYFNLREITSDIDDNRVVTGVRLVKNNQIIHIQIQEGTLIERGLINKTTLRWKPVDNYTIQDHHVMNHIDYHTMNWRERSIDMDDLEAPPEHVLTGLRFRKIAAHLNLEIRATPFNFSTGKLFSSGYSFWIGNDYTEASMDSPRKRLYLSNPDIPLRRGPHLIDSQHNQYIMFQESSMDSDASQSTVPFIDSQILASKGFPLSGAGLMHRGKPGSGGFIAPKVITYDFSMHLIPDFPLMDSPNTE